MKLKDFYNYIKIFLNENTSKEKESRDIDLNNKFILQLIKKFMIKVNEYLINNNEDEDYKKKFIEKLKDLPLVINNMKGGNKK